MSIASRNREALELFECCAFLSDVYRETYLGTALASAGSLERKHHFNSWLISATSIPGITMNLHASISRASELGNPLHRKRTPANNERA